MDFSNVTPEQLRMAQQSAANMDPETMLNMMRMQGRNHPMFKNNPGMYDQYMQMYEANPEMMKQQMQNATPEQLKRSAEAMSQMGSTTGSSSSSSSGAAKARPAPAACKLKDVGVPAETKKNEGNVHFKMGEYKQAVACYEEALMELDSTGDPLSGKHEDDEAALGKVRDACQLNLSMCLLKTKSDFPRVVRECSEVLRRVKKDQVKPLKALCRRGQAYLAIPGKLHQAESDFKACLELEACSEDKNSLEMVHHLLAEVAAKRATDKNGSTSSGKKKDKQSVFLQGKSASGRVVRDAPVVEDITGMEEEEEEEERGSDEGGMNPTLSDVEETSQHSSFSSSSSSAAAASAAAAGGGMHKLDEHMLAQGKAQMANMDPAMLKMQVANMRSVSKDTLRKMSPQYAPMSDSQLDMAMSQMEMMASNPAMFKSFQQQLSGMDAKSFNEHVQMQKSNGSSSSSSSPAIDAKGPNMQQASELMANMDSKSMVDMIRMQRDMLRTNPGMFEMIRQSNPAMANMTKEQLESQLDSMLAMDSDQLETMMKYSKTAAKYVGPLWKCCGPCLTPVLGAYQALNRATGGQAFTIVAMAATGILVYWLF